MRKNLTKNLIYKEKQTIFALDMKDEIKILEIDEECCICKAISKIDSKIHIFNIQPWILIAYLDKEYEVEFPELTENCINVLSFKEKCKPPKKNLLWFL